MPSLLVVHAVDRPGGAELALLRVAPLLLERGWRITMTGPTGRRPAEAPADVHWRAQPVGGLGRGRGAQALRAFGAFRRMAEPFDVVYLNGTVPGRLLPALRPPSLAAPPRPWAPGRAGGGRPLGSPVGGRAVLHVHDMVSRVPRFWGAADALLADSSACGAPLARRLGRRVDVTGCPVDLDPPAVDPPWTRDGRPVVAFVGRIEPRKSPHDLITATAAIRSVVPDVRVVLVGDDVYGADRSYRRMVDRRASDAGIERWPWQSGGPGLLRHVDVLVVPSLREPGGTVVSEAHAVGVPVVATAVDGLVEVVDDGRTGRLIPTHDPAALAHGVIWALRERTLAADACRQAAARWSLERVTDRIEAALLGREAPAGSPAVDPPAGVGAAGGDDRAAGS
ncbi:MAG: glycosyltransferase family 4 protein [Solirubrobacteraceae bacterium]|nr:glycosyltransferase family 4 protein [Solirubrobacteraceae bacterium]